ncbi:hypothetical protein SCOCK_70149 [Actinacidiphila cocklensis]|uniref:Transposase n=1 Tax=Actinacidiphila cocklensis TaxID=887465 RepID=A0A9W4E3J0_9ACTN|nr:hypothetical protein SCOCK_70149 [Actinacidiphila cocklensis]
MTASNSLPLHALTEDNLASAGPGLLRAMVKTFADAAMSAEADAMCNADCGQVSDERVTSATDFRPREWGTRADRRTRDPQAAAAKLVPGLAAGTPPGRAGPHLRGRHRLPHGVSTHEWRNPRSPSASPSRRSPRSARWPSTWTSKSPRSATGPRAPARMRLSGPTPAGRRSCARFVAPSPYEKKTAPHSGVLP